MFVNFSNHSSEYWAKEQLSAANKYGAIRDIGFPSIDPYMKKEEVKDLVDKYVKEILDLNPDCVMCQGEFCFTYNVVKRLKENHIKVVAACSERVVEEKFLDGETKKISTFKFVQFREY